mmetsp:Transcript_25955/g.49337  ORF Transcript_25955/g.49337 Transcript_25955/m.49337 type:complete len:354 (+) Transcript_25955:104-1165(+)
MEIQTLDQQAVGDSSNIQVHTEPLECPASYWDDSFALSVYDDDDDDLQSIKLEESVMHACEIEPLVGNSCHLACASDAEETLGPTGGGGAPVGGGSVTHRLARKRRSMRHHERARDPQRLRLSVRSALVLGFLVPVSLLGLAVMVWPTPPDAENMRSLSIRETRLPRRALERTDHKAPVEARSNAETFSIPTWTPTMTTRATGTDGSNTAPDSAQEETYRRKSTIVAAPVANPPVAKREIPRSGWNHDADVLLSERLLAPAWWSWLRWASPPLLVLTGVSLLWVVIIVIGAVVWQRRLLVWNRRSAAAAEQVSIPSITISGGETSLRVHTNSGPSVQTSDSDEESLREMCLRR